MAAGTTAELDRIRTILAEHDQEHVLHFYDELDQRQQEALLNQITAINFDQLDRWIEQFVRNKPEVELPRDLQPAPYFPNRLQEMGKIKGKPAVEHFRGIGEELIRDGRIAAFTVAGGQGTRLGWNGPKGTFPATPATGKPLFRVFAEQILAAQERWSVTIPWYIMTSPMNDQDTRDFFADNNCFGMKRSNIFMFPQGTMPSLSIDDGKLLLAEKGRLATNPDGHGGSIKALADSGAIDDMIARGIDHISYFQVDNPLVRVIDPLFIGLHAAAPESSQQMSSKMVRKTDPAEKVGVFCHSEGKTIVVEYSDLPEELANLQDDAGNLQFNAGSIAIHMIGVSFVQELTQDPDDFKLPFHRAEKKVPHIDIESGGLIEPEQPNAVKLETFVFDALPLAERSIVYETLREEEFAPIKNAEGVDSPQTSHQLQRNLFGGWLEQRGVTVPRDSAGNVIALIEISPLTATGPEELDPEKLPPSVEPGEPLVL